MARRPPVSVVMPFAGDEQQAHAAAEALRELERGPEDELLLVDNSGSAIEQPDVTVIAAPGEHSPAHARNTGAKAADRDWILFLDADCRPRPDLLEAYFSEPIPDRVGALAGEVVGVAEAASLAARYGAARGFLSQQNHLAHPYLPRAVAANLLVRRAAFERRRRFLRRAEGG